ncbi:MAG: hypothetical protein M2R45_05384 [Verrucomicrobia subdivision 3 bacterium]|nr:hypothetical protein [Limisphaerales bacterium]MCS1415953.1 hypothetical protein [Limisphaerales bacterium]
MGDHTQPFGYCLVFVNCLESADIDFCAREAIRIGADYIQADRSDWGMEILQGDWG